MSGTTVSLLGFAALLATGLALGSPPGNAPQ